jgi:hypothetical protein
MNDTRSRKLQDESTQARNREVQRMTMAENLFLRESKWAEDIAGAFASAKEIPPERRLVVFLAALSLETLRLAGAESDEGGEAVTYAAICLLALFTDTTVAPSDRELHRWSSHTRVMLILEFLQRRGYLRVDYGNALDPLGSQAAIRIIGTWPDSISK